MSELVGQTLGHYRVVDKIGAGGMGEVYRARDRRLDRDVAIKVLPGAMAHDGERLARFEREARAVARLAHPNILEIHELGEHEGRPYMVTEVLEGKTLRERLQAGQVRWRRAAEVGADIADGLAAAHRAGIVHRDLKPSNVFLTSDGRVKLLDFGLARLDEAVDPEADTMTHSPEETQAGTVLGTVGYMAPEQVVGKPADVRSDIFSLGCVLYEMVSGTRAFAADTAVETMNAILRQDPPEISSADETLPPELAGAIRRCLEKQPDARFQSASDLAYNLRTISGVRIPSAAVQAQPVRLRGRAWPWVAAAAVAAIAGVIGLFVWLPWRDLAPVEQATFQPEEVEETQWMAVAPLENRTSDPNLDILGQRAVDVIVQGFAEAGQAAGVLTMDAVPYPPTGKGASGMRVQSDGFPTGSVGPKGPHTLLSGTFYLDGDTLELRTRLTDYDTGELVYAFEPIQTSRAGSSSALDDLAERVTLAVTYHWGRRTDIRVMPPPSSVEARSEQLRGYRLKAAEKYDEAIAAFESALELDPDYFSAWEQKFHLLRERFQHDEVERQLSFAQEHFEHLTPFQKSYLASLRASVDGDLSAQLSATRQMVQIAPHLNWPLYNLVGLALESNRPAEALEVASRHPEFFRGSWSLLLLTAHHLLGNYEEELHGAQVALEEIPDRGNFYFHEGAALAALKQVDEVEAVIDRCLSVALRDDRGSMNAGTVMGSVALELRAHGDRRKSEELALRAVEWFKQRAAGIDVSDRDPWGLLNQSVYLLLAGRLDDSRANLLELERRGWQPIIVSTVEASIAARTGRDQEARRIFDELPSMDDRDSPGLVSYHRACIAAQLGEKDRAVELLRQAYAEGFNTTWQIHCDFDLEPLWDYPPFQELIAPKG